MKTLVVTEKKSVAEDFAKVLGGFSKKGELSFERDDMVIAWASGHLMELKGPAAYDEKWKRWTLGDLPILPKRFERGPREQKGKGGDLLKNLVKHMIRKDVGTIINACDAGREGELIFNLILDHAGIGAPARRGAGRKKDAAGGEEPERDSKPVRRLWLQSMTAGAIRQAFDDLKDAREFKDLRDAAYSRDEADWLVGMNGTRGFTKKFMGRAKAFFAVGRVKTPTLAFLVDREREIDAFRPVPYFQVDATFDTGNGTYSGRWTGPDEDGKRGDRVQRLETARNIATRAGADLSRRIDLPGAETGIAPQDGLASAPAPAPAPAPEPDSHGGVYDARGALARATERHTSKSEIAPLLYDLTSIQREASARFGYTLDRTLSLVQSLYEAKKAVTYPRTSSRYLPNDYSAEIPRLVMALRNGEFGHVVARALDEAGGSVENLRPVARKRVFDDAKVSDHFALIPTGENPKSLRDDERRIYELILRRFLAVFLPEAVWDQVVRETVAGEETFVTRERRLQRAGWRAVEPVPDHADLPALPADGAVKTLSIEIMAKETMPPARYTDGSLVKAMETAGKELTHPEGAEADDQLDDELLEGLKEKGIGTPATRAAIVKDLIDKQLARRSGRNILPTPLGCTLVRIVRNLDLGVLAKPDLTGTWEYRLAQMAHGGYTRREWDAAIRQQVTEIVDALKNQEGGNEKIFAVDHPPSPPLLCPTCQGSLLEKTFSYMCSNEECETSISKSQKGKYLFPETLVRLLTEGRVGPMTGFDGTRAAGTLVLGEGGLVDIAFLDLPSSDADGEPVDGDEPRREEVPEGTVMGRCPRCGGEVRREGSGYRCEKNVPRAKDKACDFRLSERIKYRWLPPAQVRKMLSGEKTDDLFGFVSMRGRKFKAKLYYEGGELKWEFPPRAVRPPKPEGQPPAKGGARGKGGRGRRKPTKAARP